MPERLPCKSCGELIHPDTAAKNDGLCMPCKGGYRTNIEAGKKRRERERAYEQSAERRYWLELVRRVHATKDGLQQITNAEKTYSAVSCLIGEVYNGGFDQFFSNSTGALYAYAFDGLLEMEAEESAAHLARAKQILFGVAIVPVDQMERNRKMRQSSSASELETLDKEFWADREGLGGRCAQYAATHGLYKDG